MKLEGIRVVDFSQFLPGPHLSMMMADHGADVILVEPPGGEPVRRIGLSIDGDSVWFGNVSRGKRSISVNLKQAEARELMLKLLDQADVLIEAFRPGVMERLGLGYKAVKARNPRIVYCSISAYGQTGPKRLKPAHDLSIQADSGVVSINEGLDGAPTNPAMPCADMAASLMALSGILMALLRRERGGAGDYLDISMQDALIAWTPNVMGPVFAERRPPEPKHERSWGGSAFYRLYRTRDGRHLSLGGSELAFARNLLTALGREDLIELCALPPGPAQDPVKQFLEQTFATRTLAEWDQFLRDIDVCYAPVRDLFEAIHEPHLQAREMLLHDEDARPHLGVPIKFSEEPARPVLVLPRQGEHAAELLASLGYDDATIEDYFERGVLIRGTATL